MAQPVARRFGRWILRSVVLSFALLGATVAGQYLWLTHFLPRNLEYHPCFTETAPPYTIRGQNDALSSFFSFAGLEYGDTRQDVLNGLGEPEDWGNRRRGELVYLDRAIEFQTEVREGRVYAIRLRNGDALAARLGSIEPLARYLGEHVRNVIGDFGAPAEINADIFKYRFSDPGRVGEVEFSCYEFHGCACSQIDVRWQHR